MYYQITVTKDDQHYFSTCDKSVIDIDNMREVYKELKEQFTSDKGYKITVMLRYTRADVINMEKEG